MLASKEIRAVGPRQVGGFRFSADAAERNREVAAMIPSLHMLGISGLSEGMANRMFRVAMDAGIVPQAGIGMDADLPGLVTTPSITVPIQFLQNWLPGLIGVITQARRADELMGISTAGKWEDEEIVQGILEQLGTAIPYGDTTNVPKSSWNTNWERRTVVRFEEGMSVGVLEEARASRAQINSSEQKRKAATNALEIERNYIGFFGFNNGNNRTFGFLNDPNLPAASAFPATGTGSTTTWSTKTFLNICADIRGMISSLRTSTGDVVDPSQVDLTLAVATACVDYLSTTSDFGISVTDWLKDAYPRVRVKSAPELNNAISNQNACYLYAESVSDDVSTDDGRTWLQVVPAKFRMLGVEQRAKMYVEDYSNATAGAFLKRPYAVVRRYGC